MYSPNHPDRATRPLLQFCAALMLLLPLAGGCNGEKGGGQQNADNKPQGIYPPPQSPGIEFTKTTAGLPSLAMDYIGTQGFSLAGAKKSNQVFFATPTSDGKSEIYARDLRTGIRAKIASVDQMVPGSMTVDHNGKQLVYCRLRDTSKYIDDPSIDTPAELSLPYRYDLEAGQETALFDFRDPAWLPYRNSSLSPISSNDGSRVACIGFNNDLSILGYTSDRWLRDYERLKSSDSELSDSQRTQLTEAMLSVFKENSFTEQFKRLGISVTPGSTPGEKEKTAMTRLRDSLPPPEWVLMLWENGSSKLVKIKQPEGTEGSLYTLAAVGPDHIVLASSSDRMQRTLADYLILNVEDGSLSPLKSVEGVPMHVVLSEEGSELLLVYNPLDEAGERIEEQSVFERLSLAGGDGSAPVELGYDYGSIMDLTPDGRTMLAQDQYDRDLYMVELESGERTKLMNFVAGGEIGVFLPGAADQGVFLENGILFRFDIPEDPQDSDLWRNSDYFEEYDEKARAWLAKLGFTPGAEAGTSWEGRKGIGMDELGGVLFDPGYPDGIALLRYDAKAADFTSLYFPNGYNIQAAADVDRGKVDAFGAEELAEHVVKQAGWYTETTRLFQPGDAPLYDGPSDSYVFIFRDGYNLPDSGPWVVNSEATVRVNASSGRITEMSIVRFEPDMNPVLTAGDEEITVKIRNFKDTPIPPQAKVLIDTPGKRLVMAAPRETKYGPAPYAVPLTPKVYYEVDVFIEQGGDLVWTARVDPADGSVLDQLYYLPSRARTLAN